MPDPWSNSIIEWLIGKILDRLSGLSKRSATLDSEHERLKARLLDLMEQNERLTKILSDETQERLSLQAENRILKAKLASLEKAAKPRRKSSAPKKKTGKKEK